MAQSPLPALPFHIRAELFLQLAQMEAAGLPHNQALATLRLPGKAQARLEDMQRRYGKSGNSAPAGEQSGLYTKIDARLIQAALNAGSPAAMYRRLADVYAEHAKQVASVRSKLMLPGVILLIALAVQPLPSLVLGTIGVFGYAWKVAGPIIVIALIWQALKWFARSAPNSREKSPWQKVPIYGPMFVRRNLRDFFECLALMLEAGISLLDALPAALEAVEDGDIRRELAKIRHRIEKGLPLADALEGVSYIRDPRVISFTQTGEASGTLPEMLLRHVNLESEAIAGFWAQVAEWMPRILYGLVALWMMYSLLSGGGLGPRVPADI
jgi:general secretion pathway protein F